MNATFPDFSETSWEVTKDKSLMSIMEPINKKSDTFNHLIVEKKDMNGIPFVATFFKLPPDTKQSRIDIRAPLFERIIKILNVTRELRFPEIVDLIKAKTPRGYTPVMITEYIYGKNLNSAIKSVYFANTPGDKIYDPEFRKKAFVSLRRIKKVLLELLSIQETLYKYNLLHISMIPDHIIVQIDDIVRVRGMRGIILTDGKYIIDKAILETKYYGSLLYKRYTPEIFQNYYTLNGNVKINALNIVAYQLGIMLFDLVTKGNYTSQKFNQKTITDAEYALNPKLKKQVKNCILQLCNPDTEFNSLDQIEALINDLEIQSV